MWNPCVFSSSNGLVVGEHAGQYKPSEAQHKTKHHLRRRQTDKPARISKHQKLQDKQEPK